ncbi:MAG: hypothetical protein V3V95_08270 [Thermodesulfobacteriota bacterium]
MYKCFSCNSVVEVGSGAARNDTCPKCNVDLKVCLNCSFYDDGAYNECHETQAERVVEKDNANFCEFFNFMDSVGEETKEEFDTLEDLKDLFKDS